MNKNILVSIHITQVISKYKSIIVSITFQALSNRVVQEIFVFSISQFLNIKLKRVVTEGIISLIKQLIFIKSQYYNFAVDSATIVYLNIKIFIKTFLNLHIFEDHSGSIILILERKI